MLQTQKIIAQGAEARIIKQGISIIKKRISKGYRIKELDKKIRKQRTKSETKLLEKASKLVNIPQPVKADKYNITMPLINGLKLSDNLDKLPLNKQLKICKQIGKDTAKLHDADIIHGDLTTSNMILVDDEIDNKEDGVNKDNKKANSIIPNKRLADTKISNNADNLGLTFNNKVNNHGLSKQKFKIYFIDFGLGYTSKKIEDKAVDIHLLRQALEAKHFRNWEKLFGSFIKGYKISSQSHKVLEQLKKVEARGRYKEK